MRWLRYPKSAMAAVALLSIEGGCSGSDSGGSSVAAGGNAAVGGATNTGGSDSTALSSGGVNTGGNLSTGGAAGGTSALGGNTGSSKVTGGSMSTGGSVPTGGSEATGGAVNTGGTPFGGSAATGGRTGVSASGGTRATGGTAATGGTNAGGAQATGGSKATGGAPATGGSKTTGGTAATGGSPGTGGSSSNCMIPTYNAGSPPQTLTLTGNLGTHDPAVILANGTYYLFATGNGIGAKTSTNLTAWTGTPDVFSSIPAWVANSISGVTNIWAPDISYWGGQYHLYYAVSTFGSNKSCIGHATRASLSSGSWADHGSVICSNVGTTDNWNAIDPNVIVDDAGTPWMDFGSFWNGIMLIKLDATGARADTSTPQNIARASSIEAPYIIHQCGYYYLFVSFGSCCGSPWDYNIRVGRSTSVTGPYVDKAGTNMSSGGGTLLVQGNSTWTAPGHNAVLVTANGTYNIYHALDANHANPTLRVSQLALDAQGWPVSAGP
jgi:arabinan endo-1,5-alpha-L-arabinosidase